MMPHLPHVLTLLLMANGATAGAPTSSVGRSTATDADLVALANDVRFEDCGAPDGAPPLELDVALDAVAAAFAAGAPLHDAIDSNRYPAAQAAGLRLDAVRLDARRIAGHLGERFCERLGDPSMSRIAAVRRGESLWLVIAAPDAPRAPEPAAATDAEADTDMLSLVNEARGRARQCGGKRYAAAAPLQWAAPLEEASREHARDMARRDYFDHVTPDGDKPTDRLARTGYEWTLTGENIAKGEMSAEEALRGWLASPGHCANIMDPRFTEMGFAVADGDRRGEVYWVQTFASPRSGTEAR